MVNLVLNMQLLTGFHIDARAGLSTGRGIRLFTLYSRSW